MKKEILENLVLKEDLITSYGRGIEPKINFKTETIIPPDSLIRYPLKDLSSETYFIAKNGYSCFTREELDKINDIWLSGLLVNSARGNLNGFNENDRKYFELLKLLYAFDKINLNDKNDDDLELIAIREQMWNVLKGRYGLSSKNTRKR